MRDGLNAFGAFWARWETRLLAPWAAARMSRALAEPEPEARPPSPHELGAAQAPFLLAMVLVYAYWTTGFAPQVHELQTLFGAGMVIAYLTRRHRTPLATRIALAAQIVILDRFYRLIMQFNRHRGVFWDGTFLDVDRAIFGGWPLDLGNQTSHLGAEAWALAYGMFIPFLFGTMVSVALGREPRAAARFFAGLTSVYAISYLGYLVFPTMGPYALPLHEAPIPGGPIFAFVHGGIADLGSCGDAFPSLHTAAVVYILGHERRYFPARFAAFLPWGVAIVAATLPMRMHYLVDLVAGSGIGLVGIWLCTRLPAFLHR